MLLGDISQYKASGFVSDLLADDDDIEMWEVLFTPEADIGFVGHSAFITGWILDVILLVMAVCSLPFVRRSGHFQVNSCCWCFSLWALIPM